jgi:hypothetical protein
MRIPNVQGRHSTKAARSLISLRTVFFFSSSQNVLVRAAALHGAAAGLASRAGFLTKVII